MMSFTLIVTKVLLSMISHQSLFVNMTIIDDVNITAADNKKMGEV